MPTPQQRLDLDRIMAAIDAPVAFAVLVGDHNEPEMISKGIVDDKHLFWILQQLTLQLAQDIYSDFTESERSQMRVVLPTREDAQRLGILRARR